MGHLCKVIQLIYSCCQGGGMEAFLYIILINYYVTVFAIFRTRWKT